MKLQIEIFPKSSFYNTYILRNAISKFDSYFFSGKGIGRVRIEPKFNTTVDVFVTHTIADGTKMVKIPVLYTVSL